MNKRHNGRGELQRYTAKPQEVRGASTLWSAWRPEPGKREPFLRRSPLSGGRAPGHLASLLIIFGLCIAGTVVAPHHPVTPVQALSHGIEWVTWQRFAPGPWLELVILVIALANIRSLWLGILAYRPNTPIEVRLLDNATDDQDLDTHRLDVAFRDFLALSRLYDIPAVPGDQEPDRLIDVLNVSAARGWRGVVAAAYAYTIPQRAFIISAALRVRDEEQGCGVSVQVRRLPGLATHLDSHWSTTFERALQRAAYAIGAHIVQQTKACRNVPWSSWQQRKRPIPASLFRDYQRAKRMVRERRYDEALALYHRALLEDTGNIGMRYDIGQVYERLKLYPDALFTYLGLVDEIFPIVTALDSTSDSAPPERVSQPTWWPDEVNRDPFTVRYRYLILLGFSGLLAEELLATQWPELQTWISMAHRQGEYHEPMAEQEYRPWRATEIIELRRLLSSRLDELYGSYCQKDPHVRVTLTELLNRDISDEHSLREVRGKMERYLLSCAEHEADMLLRDIERLEKPSKGLRRVRKSHLTRLL